MENNFILLLAETKEKKKIEAEALKKQKSLSQFCLDLVLEEISK